MANLVVLMFAGLASAAWAMSRGDPRESAEAVRKVLARIGVSVQKGDRPYTIPSAGMEPTLHCPMPAVGCLASTADKILVRPFGGSRVPARRDIVAFHTPQMAVMRCGAGGTYVKRIVGLPGDRVEVRLKNGNGYVFINGKLLSEPYIEATRRAAQISYGPRTVPKGSYFVIGDNRSQSCDSRQWGWVPRQNIIGRTIAIYWPPAHARPF